MRSLILSCLAFCACARPMPTTIENRCEPPRLAASFDRNVAATVSVHYLWLDPDSTDGYWDVESGIVLDASHVLTTRPSDMASMFEWDRPALQEILVGPYDPESEQGRGRWRAKIVAQSDDLMVLTTDEPLTLPAVTTAWRLPTVGELVYAISDDVNHERIPAMVLDPRDGDIGVPIDHPSNLVVAYEDDLERPRTAVFNQRDEFVGFMISVWCPFTVQDADRQRFFGGESDVDGFYVASVQGSLGPLLRAAGVLSIPSD